MKPEHRFRAHRRLSFFATSILFPFLVAISLLSPAAPARAEPFYEMIRIDNPSPSAGAQFGFAVDGLSDINGDGIGDLAVGARGEDRVYILSGLDRSIIHTIEDPDGFEYSFGYSVKGIGDIDLDGVEDIAVSAPNLSESLPVPCTSGYCPDRGRIFVFSGSNGEQLLLTSTSDIVGGTMMLNIGYGLAPLGDINGDGIPDFSVGVPSMTSLLTNGIVFSVSGSSGKSMWEVNALELLNDPEVRVGSFGYRLAEIDDLDGDGIQDLLVAEPFYNLAEDNRLIGRAHVLSGDNGSIIRTHVSTTMEIGAFFGQGLCSIEDQDGDGVQDYAFGEAGAGLLHLYSGADGESIHTIHSPFEGGDDYFGYQTAATDDRDGDGLKDFWVGAPWNSSVYLMNQSGELLFKATAEESPPIIPFDKGFGWSISTTGDLNGDGGADLIVGKPNHQVGGVSEAGAVFLVLGPIERTIQVTTPNDPEEWYIGHSLSISWTSQNAGSQVKIEISRDGGATWSIIENATTNDQLYHWEVTGPTSDHCRIRVVSVEYPSLSDENDNDFSIRTPSLSVTAPNGGEVWELWELRDIRWTALGAGPEATVEISRDNGAHWSTISTGTPNDGLYQWSVRSPVSTTCLIRVGSNDYPELNDQSDAPFTILEPTRFIKVTSPDGGESWETGELRPITWNAADAGSHVRIRISRDQVWSTIIDSTENDGSYEWEVEGPASPGCRVRVESLAFPETADESDADFTIRLASSDNFAIERDVMSCGGGGTGSTSYDLSTTLGQTGAIGASSSATGYRNSGGFWHPAIGTAPATPTITTSAVSSITASSASSGGNVTFDSGAAVTAKGVCWSESPNPTTGDNTVSGGDGTGSFSCNITGLNPGTPYHVRAYATNSAGTAYGNDVPFTTLDDSDSDGLPDILEDAWCTDPHDADTDDDGIPDGVEDANQNGSQDPGETHPCERDSDGDGIQDGTELGYTLKDVGPDTDTSVFQPDLDPTTTTNPLDLDTDGDSRTDGKEDLNHNGRLDPGESDPNNRDSWTLPWIYLLLFEAS